MKNWKIRAAALTAVLTAILILALLAMRGFKAAGGGQHTTLLAWREAGEPDLFQE